MSRARDISDGKFANDLTVDTNTLKVDAANNRVGIGDAAPSRRLVVKDTSGNCDVLIEGGNSNASQLLFGDQDAEVRGYVSYNHSSDRLRLGAGGSDRVSLDGDGLKFGSDTAAANALDSYEEGSYTPQISATDGIGTLTYTYRVGRYTKVGNRVMFNAYVKINNKGTVAGLLRITTPFTPANISFNHVAIAHWVNGSENNQAFEGERVTYAYLAPNEPIVRFYSSNGDGGLNHLSAAHVKNGTDFMIQGTFQV